MKYQIEDIKEGMEFIIDDDKTFDELIEFYLPFRHSELSSIDPSKPGDYDSNLNEKFFRYEDSSEIYDWADKVVETYNCDHAIRLYVALATYADKNKSDRVLALDIIYCLIGLTNHQGFDDTYSQFEMSHLTIAKQVVTDWGDHEVAKFLVEQVLINDSPCPSLTNLELDIQPYYFGILSDLFGADLYFDAAKTFLEEEDYFVDDSLDEVEYIILVAKSIANDLNDKKWEEEIYRLLPSEVNEDIIKAIKKDSYSTSSLVEVVQLSLEYLDSDTWAKEIYKNYLEKQFKALDIVNSKEYLESRYEIPNRRY